MSAPTLFSDPSSVFCGGRRRQVARSLSGLVDENVSAGLVLFPSSSIQHLPVTFAQTTSHYHTIQILRRLSFIVKGRPGTCNYFFSLPSPGSKHRTGVITESRVVSEDTLSVPLFLFGHCVNRARRHRGAHLSSAGGHLPTGRCASVYRLPPWARCTSTLTQPGVAVGCVSGHGALSPRPVVKKTQRVPRASFLEPLAVKGFFVFFYVICFWFLWG